MNFQIFRALQKINGITFLFVALTRTAGGAALMSVAATLAPVTNSYHTELVLDNYQWLENASSGSTRDWTRLQNERPRSYFARLPFREGIAQQLAQLRGEESARYFGLAEKKGTILALRFKPPAQQPVLTRLSSLYPPALWRPVFDPNTYNTNGTTAIAWYVLSPEGRRVAISLSECGSEQVRLHLFDVDTSR